jgi:hypothetical protein
LEERGRKENRNWIELPCRRWEEKGEETPGEEISQREKKDRWNSPRAYV